MNFLTKFPNKQYASFLHAYFAIGFRRKTDSKQPTLRLSSKIFVPEPKFFGTYFRIFYASESNVAEQNFRGDILFPYYTSGKTLILLSFGLSSKSKLFVAS